MKTTRRAMLKLMAALFAGFSVVSTKARAARVKVADELFHDPQRFWDWWDKNLANKESLNVTILGVAKTGKTTFGAKLYTHQTGIAVDVSNTRGLRNIEQTGRIVDGLNLIMLEDETLIKDRTCFMPGYKGCRVNVRRIPAPMHKEVPFSNGGHAEDEADRIWASLIYGQEIINSDIVLFTYRLPGTDKFRVRVTKNRWGTTDDLVFCLS